MHRKIFLSILGVLLLICGGASLYAASPDDPGACLVRLDSLLRHKEHFEQAKLARIEDIKKRGKNDASIPDRLITNSRLAEEYSTYRGDSALKYIDMNIALAESAGEREWLVRAKLNKAEILTETGLLSESGELLKSITPSTLPKDIRADYYGQLMTLYSNLGNYTGEYSYYDHRRQACQDSIVSLIDSKHPDYLWYRGWNAIGYEKPDTALIAQIEKRVLSSALDSRADARYAYILAHLYERAGNCEKYKKYLAYSAIADVKIANAELASTQELAGLLFEEGDIERAYSLINYSLAQARSFPNRVRIVGITQTMQPITEAYQERSLQQQKRLGVFLVLLCVLLAVLIAAATVIFIQNRRLTRRRMEVDTANRALNVRVEEISAARAELSEANSRLTELNRSLNAKNGELNEANYVKEEYIGSIFTICSDYIRRLDDLRSSVHAKAVGGKTKEIEKLTSNPNFLREEMKNFYKTFDSTFLRIYPDFIRDFNSLLDPTQPVKPKENEILNTELRIYALVRLGITDSVRIAEFLHCSPQTVYNYRFRIRSRAIVPKEKFPEYIQALGKHAGEQGF